MFLGIEIGGTKLQAALGNADGVLTQTWRGEVDLSRGAEGIISTLQWVMADMQRLAQEAGSTLEAIGIGYGGPVDMRDGSVIKSHHVRGWDGYPLQAWAERISEVPCVVANDADVACLGEALHGAGLGHDPLFYLTVGSGIGGGFFTQGQIYAGQGRGAAEIGHLRVGPQGEILEHFSSGWGIQNRYHERTRAFLKVPEIAALASHGHPDASFILDQAVHYLALSINQMITLLCPARVVIGGGVSLLGEQLFGPLRQKIEAQTFAPYAGLTTVVPAALGEEVVLHGALALAKQKVMHAATH
jgi:glucokinase